MATTGGELCDIITGNSDAPVGRFTTWTGINSPPPTVIVYFMAQFDNNNVRYFWVNTDATTAGRPATIGGGVYQAATLVIEGKIVLNR